MRSQVKSAESAVIIENRIKKKYTNRYKKAKKDKEKGLSKKGKIKQFCQKRKVTEKRDTQQFKQERAKI